ncbi:MAG: glycosyltransferase [Planctomycetota bacterium]
MSTPSKTPASSADPPRVAFAMPVYNGSAYLCQALDALQAQTETRWIAMVTDNASTDATSEIANEYAKADPRIRYFRNETNLGANGNFNRSMERALETGAPFVKWAAHDDCPHPEFLSACLDALEDRPEAIGAHTAFRLVDEDGQSFRFDANAGGFLTPDGGGADVWTWSPDAWDALGDPAPNRRLRRFLRDKTGQSLVYGIFRSQDVAATRPFAMPGAEDAWCAEMLLRGALLSVPRTLFDQRLHAGSARHMSRREYIEYETGAPPKSELLPSIGRAVDYAGAIVRAPLTPTETVRAFIALASFAIGLGRLRNLLVPGPNNYLGLNFSRGSRPKADSSGPMRAT